MSYSFIILRQLMLQVSIKQRKNRMPILKRQLLLFPQELKQHRLFLQYGISQSLTYLGIRKNRKKQSTNQSFFTKTCEQRLYAFRSVSIKKNESGCAPLEQEFRQLMRIQEQSPGLTELGQRTTFQELPPYLDRSFPNENSENLTSGFPCLGTKLVAMIRSRKSSISPFLFLLLCGGGGLILESSNS